MQALLRLHFHTYIVFLSNFLTVQLSNVNMFDFSFLFQLSFFVRFVYPFYVPLVHVCLFVILLSFINFFCIFFVYPSSCYRLARSCGFRDMISSVLIRCNEVERKQNIFDFVTLCWFKIHVTSFFIV